MKNKPPIGAIQAAGVLWMLIGLYITFFQPEHLSAEGRVIAELICAIGGSLHLTLASLMKYIVRISHGR